MGEVVCGEKKEKGEEEETLLAFSHREKFSHFFRERRASYFYGCLDSRLSKYTFFLFSYSLE